MNLKSLPFLQKFHALAVAGLLFVFTSCATAQQPGSKKLIQYGWDRPTPEYLRDNLSRMEQSPFDGVVFKLPGNGGEVFNIDKWDAEASEMQQQLPILAGLKWNSFTDNFLVIRATSTMDWFSDDDWATVLAKVTLNAKAARAAHAQGIVFDPEPYGKNPWEYAKQKHAAQKSFVQYSAQARARGAQFIRAMQAELPELKLLMFYQYVLFYGALKSPDDPALQKHQYGLMLPFLNGMLEVAGDKVQLIDGNEHSYSATKAAQFERAYKLMREPQAYVPPALYPQYQQHVRAAQAVYIDLLFGERRGIDDLSEYMTPEQRMLWFEHNLYHALQQSDEYVWTYNEQVQWWRNRLLPAGINDAIVRTKARVASCQPLGFDVDAIVEQARQDRQQHQAKKPA